ELMAPLRADVRDGFSARTSELHSLLNDKPSPLVASKVSIATEVYEKHGRRLLANLEETRKLLDVPGEWTSMSQLDVLRAERQELAESERRLCALASDWRDASRQPVDVEISTGFGRQAAHVLAGKLLL